MVRMMKGGGGGGGDKIITKYLLAINNKINIKIY